jgi:hypothetical protein
VLCTPYLVPATKAGRHEDEDEAVLVQPGILLATKGVQKLCPGALIPLRMGARDCACAEKGSRYTVQRIWSESRDWLDAKRSGGTILGVSYIRQSMRKNQDLILSCTARFLCMKLRWNEPTKRSTGVEIQS